jgi:hypothetical protein
MASAMGISKMGGQESAAVISRVPVGGLDDRSSSARAYALLSIPLLWVDRGRVRQAGPPTALFLMRIP